MGLLREGAADLYEPWPLRLGGPRAPLSDTQSLRAPLCMTVTPP
eukprot:NODE_20507_length_158_cov_26.018349_g18737_i0.p2 GENE.NODE_20507_length_158_cov_26.018349_g18737_i0~~NODE_20507_length_158_cov_26.018349_g18737_i0.p2  ORF type:complete len:52 (+),score=11.55 NODE_20507_length_158_cov_26.018349_g18737_i0:25-156(+)